MNMFVWVYNYSYVVAVAGSVEEARVRVAEVDAEAGEYVSREKADYVFDASKGAAFVGAA